MRHFNILGLLFVCVTYTALVSCEKELPLYSESQNRLIFDYYNPADSLRSYSFIYTDPSVDADTVWYKVHTMGFVTDNDRPFELEQVVTGENDAVPGKHYVAFDDAANLKKYYYIPAGTVETTIPVIVLRDPSLRNATVNLKFTIKPTGEFVPGYEAKSTVALTIADFLSQPSAWKYYSNYYFGSYGVAKHRFMIEATGFKWDNDFLSEELHVEDASACDRYYMVYLEGVLRTALDKLNAERMSQGLGKLAEEDGTEVSFPLIAL